MAGQGRIPARGAADSGLAAGGVRGEGAGLPWECALDSCGRVGGRVVVGQRTNFLLVGKQTFSCPRT
jgi:hypothetical protein